MASNSLQGREVEAEPACQFCRRRFDVGYHFTCHLCGATYCYIHLDRHRTAHGFGTSQAGAPDRIDVLAP
jgi:hypothetical protein